VVFVVARYKGWWEKHSSEELLGFGHRWSWKDPLTLWGSWTSTSTVSPTKYCLVMTPAPHSQLSMLFSSSGTSSEIDLLRLPRPEGVRSRPPPSTNTRRKNRRTKRTIQGMEESCNILEEQKSPALQLSKLFNNS